MKIILQMILVIILGSLFSSEAWAQSEKAQEVVEFDANFFAVIGPGGNGNTAFLITEEGVVVIDAGETPEMGQKLLTLIRKKTDKPIRYILLTHYHTDHVLGLESFPEPALVVGHKNLYRNMQEILSEELKIYPEFIKNLKKKTEDLRKQGGPDLEQEEARLKRNLDSYEILKHTRIILPEITFDNSLVFYLGDERIEMYYPGPSHTNGSSVVYFPGRKTIHMGDMVFAGYHTYIDEQAGADTKNWISFLEQVLNWEIDTVIPGHGPIGGREHLEREIQYLQDLRAEVSAAIQEGKNEEEVINTVKMELWKDLTWPEILPLVIKTVYQELVREKKND
jgi:glyoxylase-like metal-dependent hydrolase (beta-lactamase superfamily II)